MTHVRMVNTGAIDKLSSLNIDVAKDWGGYDITNLGELGVEGKVTLDVSDTEALLIRKNGDAGDVLAVDTSSGKLLFGERDTPSLVSMEHRSRFAPTDTTTGLYWNINSSMLHDAIGWRYKATFFGYPAASPINYLLEVSLGGFDFRSQFHQDDSNYVNVGIQFGSYDVSDTKVGGWYMDCRLSGDLELRHAYSGSQVLVFEWATKNIKIVDGHDVILETTNGTKIGTATNQKLGFFNATPIVQPTAAGASGYAAVGGTNVNSNDTFTGGVGSTAYTVGDIVAIMKNLGLMAA